jgi:G2/mitotic-specific cyclin 2
VVQDDMDVEYDPVAEREADVNSMIAGEQEVEEMVVVEADVHDDEGEEETAKVYEAKPARVWPEVSTERAEHYKREVKKIRDTFEEELDMDDTTMVSEYAEEIYEYMCELEVRTEPTLPRFSLSNETQICRRR